MPWKQTLMTLLKSPVFWSITVLLLLGIAIVIITNHNGKDPCHPGFHRGPCGDQCVEICDDGGIYNCETGKCGCNDGFGACGDVDCCSNTNCHKDPNDKTKSHCCEPNRQCKVSESGEVKCCGDGQICSGGAGKVGTCVSQCGNLTCDAGESCLKVEGLNTTQQAKFLKDFPKSAYIDGTTGYACSAPPVCMFDDEISAPSSLDEIYPCTDIFNGTGSDGTPAYCTSDNPADAPNCHKNYTAANCPSTCTVRHPLTDSIEDVQNDIKNIPPGNYSTEYLGNFCGSGDGQWQHLVQQNQHSGSKDQCTASDCWYQLANPNTVDVNWDETSMECTALRNCVDNDPVEFKTSGCTGAEANSSICSDKNKTYLCNDDGSIILYPTTGWASNAEKGALFKCLPNQAGDPVFSDPNGEMDCINNYCLSTGEKDPTNKKMDCCAPGWSRPLGSKKCYQDPFIPQSLCTNDNDNCHDDPANKCGAGYHGQCWESSFPTCHDRCWSGNEASLTPAQHDIGLDHCMCKNRSDNSYADYPETNTPEWVNSTAGNNSAVWEPSNNPEFCSFDPSHTKDSC